eukprot:CAMPEP_0171308630 /NCGR_PEP_ID=MMETSP0816-20121228/18719_1 /TAXON_ID=420281 /ORGANISM="Proboscia inermis, Strain CCAP1064/1" /LENGTH=218 /DNA_ID=CAMNT_0011791615 /DNA_START=94 /DNA_END=752 /DNA_ORIENTATION=+
MGDISETENVEDAESDAVVTVKGGTVNEVAPKKQSVGCRRMQQGGNRRFKKNAAAASADESTAPKDSEAVEKAEVTADKKVKERVADQNDEAATPEVPAADTKKEKHIGLAKLRRKPHEQKSMEGDPQYVEKSTRLSPHARLHAQKETAVALALVYRVAGDRSEVGIFWVTMCLVKSFSCLIWAQEVGVRYIAADVHSGVSLRGVLSVIFLKFYVTGS